MAATPVAWSALLLALLLPTPAHGGALPPAAHRVLLISCDGLRPDAIDAADAPVLQHLIATGSFQSAALDEFPSSTLPNHTSMLTGLSVAHHGVLANADIPGRVSATTIFDVAKQSGLTVGFFISKSKLGYLCEQGGADVWRYVPDVGGLTDEVVAAVAAGNLQLIFVHLGEPDGAGHRDGWMSEPYLAAVSLVDAAVGRILEALEAKGVLDQTVVVITADHGGHCTTHGWDIPEDRFIPFIVSGPGVAAGRRLCEQVHVMDAAAMALYVLGLPTDSAADGKPVREAAADYVQPSCTAPPAAFGCPCGLLSVFCAVPVLMLLARRSRRRRV